MPKPNFDIEHVTAYIIVDPRDNSEGIMAARDPRTGEWIPMIGADSDRLESLRPIAIEIAKAAGVSEVQVARFDRRVDVETIKVDDEP